ncbi:FkbM family methyltransferase [Pyxidicoccus caerfyrddinensis]|uniref:FkbM family methyltransferase n=1 Tax=Pyxidicoccus caerfyrddinensis TaxID=2709663 RepID=UPI0013DC0AAE|nr:FkbM family methyltransferase [Pyxidicoccus caerfyrddinensis]
MLPLKPALQAARIAHSFFPFSQLRTARLLLGLNGQQPLEVERQLFGYDIALQAHRSTTHMLLYLQGEKFLSDLVLIAPHVRPGMVAFDVGANIGYLSLYLRSRIGPDGQLHSFEPEPDNFAELDANLRRNGLDNCHAVQAAVGSQEGMLTFAPGLNGHVPEDGAPGISVPVVTLDGFIAKHGVPRVDFVKIDVEGFELDVLTGMKDVLARRDKPILYIEVHGRGEFPRGDPRRVCELLEGHYRNIRAYVSPDDFKARQGHVRRVLNRLSPFDSIERQCRVELSEVKQLDTLRYQLLCLP